MVERRKSAPEPVKLMFDRFNKVTNDELYDSPEEIISLIQKDEEYERLKDGKGAINVIKYHGAAVLSECMDEWTEYVIENAHSLIKKSKQFTNELEEQFIDVSNFCRGLVHNTLGKDRMFTNKEFQFNYDIQKWLDDENLIIDYLI